MVADFLLKSILRFLKDFHLQMLLLFQGNQRGLLNQGLEKPVLKHRLEFLTSFHVLVEQDYQDSDVVEKPLRLTVGLLEDLNLLLERSFSVVSSSWSWLFDSSRFC